MVHGLSKSAGWVKEELTQDTKKKGAAGDRTACTVGIKTKYLQGSRKDTVRYSKVNVNPGKIRHSLCLTLLHSTTMAHAV